MKEEELKKLYQAYGSLVMLQEYLYDYWSFPEKLNVEECKKIFSRAYDMCSISTEAVCDFLKNAEFVHDGDHYWNDREEGDTKE